MLGSRPIIAFVPTAHPGRTREFYEETLGLRFVSEDAFALVFDANGVMLRVVNVSSVPNHRPAPFTILGWTVLDIEGTVRELQGRGVRFERYPGMEQDLLGIWTSPSGARIAWFKDPEGNVLSVTEP
jgi:catechol 2,3-dioxygenase-like lactoylglutathione lyase family enzyme